MVDNAITTSPTCERRGPPDAVDQRADHEHERVHAEHVRADDREDRVLAVVVVLDDDVAREVHHRDHDSEACEGREHRRANTGSPHELAERSAAAPAVQDRVAVRADQLGDPLRVGPDRTERARARPARCPPAASQGTVSARRPRASFPAKSGPKTVGPRIAPKTDPKSTYEMPRARRSGGYMSPAAARDQQRDATRGADERKPGQQSRGRAGSALLAP